MTPDVLTPVAVPATPPPAPARGARRGARRRPKTAEPALAILGLGYVGLPTGLAAAAAGLPVVGVDTSRMRLRRIRAGTVDLVERDHARLREALDTGSLRMTDNPRAIALADVVMICVPTPVHEDHSPDLRALRAACETAVRHARAGQTLILTSTSYVGTTADLLAGPLAERGLTVGEDIHVAFSPERIDPGNVTHTQEDTPRVVGGATAACTEAAAEVLGRLTRRVHRVTSMEAAELTKLYENTFRAVNIAFAYEMADAAAHYGLDPIEVTEAAATKPYGFMPFYPGAGVGGHCIPCDPHYLLDPLQTAGRRRAADQPGDGGDRRPPAARRAPRRRAARRPARQARADGRRRLQAGRPGRARVAGAGDPGRARARRLRGRLPRPADPDAHARRARAAQRARAARRGTGTSRSSAPCTPAATTCFLDDCPLLLDGTYRVGAGRQRHTV